MKEFTVIFYVNDTACHKVKVKARTAAAALKKAVPQMPAFCTGLGVA